MAPLRILLACALICVCGFAAAEEVSFSIFDDATTAMADQPPVAFSIFGEESFDAVESDHTDPPFVCSLFAPPREPVQATKPRPRQVIYFTAKWCAACKRSESTLASLRAAGWQVGCEASKQIRVVDVDDEPGLAKLFAVNALPAWVKLEHGREVNRCPGHLDPYAVGRLYTEPARPVVQR